MAVGQEELAEPLLGRVAELVRMRQFIDETRSAGSSLMVTGEPGMGKSSMLRWCVETASDQGAEVLRATGVEFESDTGYAVLHELLLPHHDAFAALPARHRDALRVCLRLAEGPPPSRSTVASATLAVLAHLASRRFVIVAVDDVQWLDRPSAAVLNFVTTRLPGTGLGVVSALREGQQTFLDHATMPRLHLGPLSPTAARDLLDGRAPGLDRAARARLLLRAQGNPLALLQLPLEEDADVSSAWREDPVLPDRLQELYAPRVERLPLSTQEFLLLAALDTSADLGVILSAGQERVGASDVRLAVARELVEVDGRNRTLRFHHPLIRSTVVGLATPSARRTAHRLLGETEPQQVERRARHLAEAMVAPEETVAALLEESASVLLRRGDPSGAVTTLLRAADLSEGASQRSRRLASAAYVGANLTGDLHRVSRLLAEARTAGLEASAALPWATAAAYALLNGDGDIATAHRTLVGALTSDERAHGQGSEPPIDAVLTLLGICFFGGRSELWEPFFEQLDRLRTPLPPALRLCVQTFAQPARDGSRALDELHSVMGDLATQTDPNHIALVGRAAFYVDELEGCRPALLRVASRSVRNGAVTPAIDASMLLAFDAFLVGRWSAAAGYARDGLRLCEERGYDLLAWPGRYCLALIAVATGDDDVGAGISDEMLLWAQPRGVRSVSAYAHHVKALSALGRSDFESAYRHASAVSEPGVVDPALAHALWLTMDLVEAAVRSGRHEEAVAHVRAMRATDMGNLSSRNALMLAASEALVASHDALGLFERALGIPGADRWPFELARVRLAYGARLRRARLHSQAREQLSAALDAFVLLGATPWVERVHSELDAGTGPRGNAPRTGAAMTSRELQVARLAASGLHNAEIAKRLDTSSRTVSAHLSHVLGKLGLTSRAGLRDALSRQHPEAEEET